MSDGVHATGLFQMSTSNSKRAAATARSQAVHRHAFPQLLKVEMMVEVQGLKTEVAKRYNGQRGKILSFDESNHRYPYRVCLDNGTVLGLKPDHMRCGQDRLEGGRKAQLATERESDIVANVDVVEAASISCVGGQEYFISSERTCRKHMHHAIATSPSSSINSLCFQGKPKSFWISTDG